MTRTKVFDTHEESIEALASYVEENKRTVEEIFSKERSERTGKGFEITYLVELYVIEDDRKDFYFNEGVLGISNEGKNCEYNSIADLVEGIKGSFRYQEVRSCGATINPLFFTIQAERRSSPEEINAVINQFLSGSLSPEQKAQVLDGASSMVERGFSDEEVTEFEELFYQNQS